MTSRGDSGSTRRAAGTWLSGPQIPGAEGNRFRGEDLGLPESGVGALASGWQRLVGIIADWLIAGGVAILIVGVRGPAGMASGFEMTMRAASPVQAITWFVMGLIAVSLFGFTPGQYLAGMRVARVDYGAKRNAAEAAGTEPRAAVGFVRALVRQVIVFFVVPALIADLNGRSMHDRATGTALVRTR
ncbi:RDD family protein [Gordonia malaquae]|uniref:RDD family protein n=1 Tax=Gordonia malaquae TaxID=410332 RepID=UPI0030C78857